MQLWLRMSLKSSKGQLQCSVEELHHTQSTAGSQLNLLTLCSFQSPVLPHRQHSSLAALRQTPEASHLALQVHSVSLSLPSGRGVSTCRALQVRHTADTRKRPSGLSTTASRQHQPAAQPHGGGRGRRDTQTLAMRQACDRHLANRSQHSESARLLSIPIGASRSEDGTRARGQACCSFHFDCQQAHTECRPHTSRPAAGTLIGQFNQRDFSKCYHLFLCFVHLFFPLTDCVVDADGFFWLSNNVMPTGISIFQTEPHLIVLKLFSQSAGNNKNQLNSSALEIG